MRAGHALAAAAAACSLAQPALGTACGEASRRPPLMRCPCSGSCPSCGCSAENGTAYSGPRAAPPAAAGSAAECCQLCVAAATCTAWAWAPAPPGSVSCELLASQSSAASDPAAVSGRPGFEWGFGTGYTMLRAARERGAVCLDGSPAVYYHSPGRGEGAAKWYVHMQGGGWCTSPDDCAERAAGPCGSSGGYPAVEATPDMFWQSEAMVTDPRRNPQMWNWNHVYIKYCDGASFAGDNATPTLHSSGRVLYFRGSRILDAFIEELLQERGMAAAADIVVGGSSAGGLAVYLHCDRWASRAPPGARVRCLADCGFFRDYEGPPKWSAHMRWLYAAQNASAGVDSSCAAAYAPAERWRCFFARYAAPHIATPLFAAQARFDSYQAAGILGSKDPAAINAYGMELQQELEDSLLASARNGAFVDSCFHHCAYWGRIAIGGLTLQQAFAKWYGAAHPLARREWVQNGTYPCAECCGTAPPPG